MRTRATAGVADARAGLSRHERPLRLGPAPAPDAAGDVARGARGHPRHPRARAGGRLRVESRQRRDASVRHRRGAAAAAVALLERRWQLVGGAARLPRRRPRARRRQALRLDLRALAVGRRTCSTAAGAARPAGARVSTGPGSRPSPRPLGVARIRPDPEQGVRPRVAAPGGIRSTASTASGPTGCRRCTTRTCRPAGRTPNRRTGSPTTSTTMRGARTWRPWYEDLMTGQRPTARRHGCFGLTPELWALRSAAKGTRR